MNDESKLSAFFHAVGLHAERLDLQTVTQTFVAQMRIGLYGGDSTVPMLPSYLIPPSVSVFTDSEPIAVAFVSSNEVRVGVVKWTGQAKNAPTIQVKDNFPLPGLDYPAPYQDLIFAIAELLEPLLDEVGVIALCIDFPLAMEPGGDGVILAIPEHLQLSDWQGQNIRAALTQELESRGVVGKELVLMNATVATQVGAAIIAPTEARYLGLTWGKTVNMSVSAPASVVPKLKGMGGKNLMLFDTASGGFCGVPCAPTELFLDRDSRTPGHNLYTKMVSTSTLGELYRFAMLKAVEHGLLTFGCGRDFLSLKKLDLETVQQFIQAPEGENPLAVFCREPADRAVAQAVLQVIFDRAVRLVCANLTAALILIGAGRTQSACIAAEGEAIETPLLRSLLEKYLTTFTKDVCGISCTLQPLNQDSVMIGGATLAQHNHKR